ncbi:Ns1 Hypothetical protein protein [Nesidiocoris tenuis]|uniref:Uncharacterized protein n=1 Tax=Nesidiocoris tenuis TaxID=355587 RepID=A0ABN7B9A0_9HEMI|nr:Ns1 Hypothetical protein protein [Nesidiocoris tenuis]
MLYLALDNSLEDCSHLPTGDAGDTELVQDYKRLCRSSTNNNKKQHQQNKPKRVAKPRVIVYSRAATTESVEEDPNADDRMIASSVVSETTFLALVSIKSCLASMSVLLRLNPPSAMTPDENKETADAGNGHHNSCDNYVLKKDGGALNCDVPLDTPTYSEISSMSSVKCAAGCAALGDKILVCGMCYFNCTNVAPDFLL